MPPMLYANSYRRGAPDRLEHRPIGARVDCDVDQSRAMTCHGSPDRIRVRRLVAGLLGDDPKSPSDGREVDVRVSNRSVRFFVCRLLFYSNEAQQRVVEYDDGDVEIETAYGLELG